MIVEEGAPITGYRAAPKPAIPALVRPAVNSFQSQLKFTEEKNLASKAPKASAKRQESWADAFSSPVEPCVDEGTEDPIVVAVPQSLRRADPVHAQHTHATTTTLQRPVLDTVTAAAEPRALRSRAAALRTEFGARPRSAARSLRGARGRESKHTRDDCPHATKCLRCM